MYTIEEVLNKIEDALNKQSTSDNLSIDTPTIIAALETAQHKFVNWVIETKNEDDIILIQKLVESEVLLKNVPTPTIDSDYFALPKNFFDRINLSVLASNDTCKKQKMLVWEVKGQNTHELLADENNKPSFEARETFYTFGKDKVRVFTNKEFTTNAYLTYYRFPVKPNVGGWIDESGKTTSTVHPEFDKRAMDKIVEITVKDLNINAENLRRFQPDNTRIISEF